LKIFWRAPSVIAENLYSWAVKQGHIGSVLTLYEITSSDDDHPDSVVMGMDLRLVRKVIDVLEKNGKVRELGSLPPDGFTSDLFLIRCLSVASLWWKRNEKVHNHARRDSRG
jgi:ESCRT-II complex subunit